MLLYHGSTNKYDVLIPHQAYDTGYAEGCQNAVYASSEKAMAIGFALGEKEDELKRALLAESVGAVFNHLQEEVEQYYGESN